MKKTILILIAILVGLFGLFSYLDKNGGFAAEKKLWKINQDFLQVTKDPNTIPDEEYDAIAQRYRKFIDGHAGSRLTPTAYILLGRVYVTKKDYAKAREVFEEIIQKYPDDQLIDVRAVAEIGRTYTLQKDDENILKTYQRAWKEYPLTDFGLSAPLIIAKYYATKEDKDKTRKAFKEAVDYYQSLIEKYPDSLAEFHSLRLIAAADMAQGKWKQSVDTLGEVLLKFSKPKFMSLQGTKATVRMINTISATKLNSLDIPIALYTRFIKENPDHPFNQTLTKMIQAFEEIKKKVETDSKTKETNKPAEPAAVAP